MRKWEQGGDYFNDFISYSNEQGEDGGSGPMDWRIVSSDAAASGRRWGRGSGWGGSCWADTFWLTWLSDCSWNQTAGQRRRQNHVDLRQPQRESGKMRSYNLDFHRFRYQNDPGTGHTGTCPAVPNFTVRGLFSADPRGPSWGRRSLLLSAVHLRGQTAAGCPRVPVRGYLWVLTQQSDQQPTSTEQKRFHRVCLTAVISSERGTGLSSNPLLPVLISDNAGQRGLCQPYLLRVDL